MPAWNAWNSGILFSTSLTKSEVNWLHFVGGNKLYISMRPFSCSAVHKIIKSESYSVMWDSLRPHGLYSPWNYPGQNTGVGSCSVLQESFPTQRSNPGLPHCRWILYQLSHDGSPRILEWVAYPFSRGIFPTQESNRDLLHRRRILYQLTYQGSPTIFRYVKSNMLHMPVPLVAVFTS